MLRKTITAMHTSEQELEGLMYATNHEANIAILREISKIRFWEQMRKLMPMIARELTAAGVDFSRVTIPTDQQVEMLIQEAMKGEAR